MSQTTTPDRFAFRDLVQAVLGDVVVALTSAPTLTPTEKVARAEGVMAMVLGLFPGDVMQMMVAGHAVMFHALAADAVTDLMGISPGPLRAKARSGAAALGRTAVKNLEVLAKLQSRPTHGWLTPPEADVAEAEADADTARTPPPANAPESGDKPEPPAPASDDPTFVLELDEPYVEMFVASPADFAARGLSPGPEALTDAVLVRRTVRQEPSPTIVRQGRTQDDAAESPTLVRGETAFGVTSNTG